jgi:hypothetical protein
MMHLRCIYSTVTAFTAAPRKLSGTRIQMNKLAAKSAAKRLLASKRCQWPVVAGRPHFPQSDIDIWIKQQSMEAIEPTKKDCGEPS